MAIVPPHLSPLHVWVDDAVVVLNHEEGEIILNRRQHDVVVRMPRHSLDVHRRMGDLAVPGQLCNQPFRDRDQEVLLRSAV